MKVRIPHQPVHIVVFLLLALLCYQVHQLTRYLVGAALCGGFGISPIVFLVDLVATVLLIVWGRRYFRPQTEA